jgi:hypothetical protein
MDMLNEMDGAARLSVEASQTSEEDHLGCVAAKKGERVDLMLFRHVSVRENGKKVPVRLALSGDLLKTKNWKVMRASVIDGEHAGFMGQRDLDMKRARTKVGEGVKASVIATKVMAAHRAKYEKMSGLHSLHPLPAASTDSSGRMYFDLMMDGHSVILLRLE